MLWHGRQPVFGADVRGLAFVDDQHVYQPQQIIRHRRRGCCIEHDPGAAGASALRQCRDLGYCNFQLQHQRGRRAK